jgi:hypothetical protein
MKHLSDADEVLVSMNSISERSGRPFVHRKQVNECKQKTQWSLHNGVAIAARRPPLLGSK